MEQISCDSGKTQLARFGYECQITQVEEGYEVIFKDIGLVVPLATFLEYPKVQNALGDWLCKAIENKQYPPIPTALVCSNYKGFQSMWIKDNVVFFPHNSKAENMAYEYSRSIGYTL